MIPMYVNRAKVDNELNDSEYRQLLKKFGIFSRKIIMWVMVIPQAKVQKIHAQVLQAQGTSESENLTVENFDLDALIQMPPNTP